MDVFDKESKLTENMFDGSFNKKKKYCSKDYWDNRIYKETKRQFVILSI